MNTETSRRSFREFTVPVAISSNTHPGDQELTIDVRFQVCNDTTCMPAATEHLKVPVTIEAAHGTAARQDLSKSTAQSEACKWPVSGHRSSTLSPPAVV